MKKSSPTSIIYLLLIMLFNQPTFGQLSGIYWIGGANADYQTFSEAVNALQNEGVSGPVTFKVFPGDYEEQITIGNIPGSGCANPVSFVGDDDYSTSVVLHSAASPTVSINGADGIIFKNMIISGKNNVIYTAAGTNCFTLEGNEIIGQYGVLIDAVSSESQRSHHHIYRNNNLHNGNTGVRKLNQAEWNAGQPKFDEGLIIEGNKYLNVRNAVSITGQKAFTINNNRINGAYTAIYATNSWYGKSISNNKVSEIREYNYQGSVFNLESSAAAKITENEVKLSEGGTGMYISTGKLEGDMLIANNIISVNGWDARGIYYYPLTNMSALDVISNYDYGIRIIHNKLEVAGYSEYIHIYVIGLSRSAGYFCILNNNLLNFSNGDIFKFRYPDSNSRLAASEVCGTDYNNEYSQTGYVYGSEHFISVNPYKNYDALIGAGIYVDEVPFDIYGNPRNDPPTIGPYEGEKPAAVSGTFTIGGEDGDFGDFIEAANFLDTHSVDDTIKFMVRPGIYRGHITLTAGNTLIFEGETGDSTDVVIEYPVESAVQVERTNVVFRSMTIQGIILHNSSGTFRNNIIRGFQAHETGVFGGTGNHKFFNNHFPEKGIHITNDKERRNGSVEAVGNTMEINEGEGMYFLNIDVKAIDNNTIIAHHQNATGIRFSGFQLDPPDQMTKNKILLKEGGVGMDFYYGFSISAELINNIISIKSGENSAGISFREGSLDLFHNSILIYGEEASGTAIYLEMPEYVSLTFKNNILTNLSGGPILKMNDDSNYEEILVSSDYNDLYTAGSVLAKSTNGVLQNLAEWRQYFTTDQHSISVDPQFNSIDSLIPRNEVLEDAGIQLAEVDEDYYGMPRDAVPTIGAVEEIAEQEIPQPSAYAGRDKTFTIPTDTIVIEGWVVNMINSIKKYHWQKISGPAIDIISANTANLKLKDPEPGTYVFEFTATDLQGNTFSDQMTLTIIADELENQAPVVDAGPDKTIYLPEEKVILTGTGKDPDGNFRAFKWEKLSGPSVTMVDANTANLKLYDLTEGVFEFRFTATDNDGAAAADQMILTVITPNQPPVVSAGPDLYYQLPLTEIILRGTGHDPDGRFKAFSWKKISGPAVTLRDAATANIKLSNIQAGEYVFRFSATDNDGATASDQMVLSVESEVLSERMANMVAATAYPNKFSNELNVEVKTSIAENYLVELFDLNGKVYYQDAFVPGSANLWKHHMDLSGINLMDGIYLVRISNHTGNYQEVIRVVKRMD